MGYSPWDRKESDMTKHRYLAHVCSLYYSSSEWVSVCVGAGVGGGALFLNAFISENSGPGILWASPIFTCRKKVATWMGGSGWHRERRWYGFSVCRWCAGTPQACGAVSPQPHSPNPSTPLPYHPPSDKHPCLLSQEKALGSYQQSDRGRPPISPHLPVSWYTGWVDFFWKRTR